MAFDFKKEYKEFYMPKNKPEIVNVPKANYMANILTGIRIACGVFIMCLPVFSEWFYFFYLLGGFTDAIDGMVARKKGEVSDFGAKFDTVADFIFITAVAVKIIESLYIPLWLIIWIVVIALIKISSHLVGYIKFHELRTVHSVLNKVCGGIVFAVPLFIGCDFAWQTKAFVVMSVCILTTVAAIVEAVIILGNKTRLN